MNTIEVAIKAPEHSVQICRKAVSMEAKSDALSRSEVVLSGSGGCLKIVITATDLGALRAALNTYLRWINMCLTLTNGPTDTQAVTG